MQKLFNLFFILFALTTAIGQELNANVIVNADLTGEQNEQVFNTLQKQLGEFINTTKWTSRVSSNNERINCNFVINIAAYSNDLFEAQLQVQSSRPIYGSSYSTPIYNFNDEDFTFRYLEFQNLNFNRSQFESNLVSVIAFHIYIILGLDADTFSPNGGDTYFQQAEEIVNFSQQETFAGWRLQDGLNSRFALTDNILSPTYKEFREALYTYHRAGFDIMSDDVLSGKEGISNAILNLENMHRRRPNSFLMRMFFDAKANEIEQIFSDGPQIQVSNLITTLNRIAPTYAAQWRAIKF